jgi:Protein of unknown function (DUF664)
MGARVINRLHCTPSRRASYCQITAHVRERLRSDDMTSAGLLVDAFDRIRSTVSQTVSGLDAVQLAHRVSPDANTIGWLVWHLTRVQDDHVATAFGVPQVWSAEGWAARFGLRGSSMETGYGHTSEQVHDFSAAMSAAGTPAAELLTGYHEATYEQTITLVSGISDGDLERVVDASWRPPVTLGVRLVSVVNDDMQHAGQAAFVRGILLRGAF